MEYGIHKSFEAFQNVKISGGIFDGRDGKIISRSTENVGKYYVVLNIDGRSKTEQIGVEYIQAIS